MKKCLPTVLLLCALTAFAAGCADRDAGKSAGVDVDLSVLSDMLAYSQTVKILETPGDYLEKTIKVRGQYIASYHEPTGLYYQFLVIGDEARCCQVALEFSWSGDHIYPDDYPEEYTEIELVGTLEDHEVLGNTYYRLTVDDITRLR